MNHVEKSCCIIGHSLFLFSSMDKQVEHEVNS